MKGLKVQYEEDQTCIVTLGLDACHAPSWLGEEIERLQIKIRQLKRIRK